MLHRGLHNCIMKFGYNGRINIRTKEGMNLELNCKD